MNKTLTKLSSLMTLALIMSACSTAPKTKTSALDGISEIDLFADRMVATVGPGNELVVKLVDQLIIAGKTEAAQSIVQAASRSLGIVGQVDLTNYKALLNEENHPLTKEAAMKFIAESPFRTEIAAVDPNLNEQIAAIERIKANPNAANIPFQADTANGIKVVQLLKTQNTEVALWNFKLQKVYGDKFNILDVETIGDTCATLNTSSDTGLSVEAAKHYTAIHTDMAKGALQVKTEGFVKEENLVTCAANVAGEIQVQDLEMDLHHQPKNAKNAVMQSYKECKLVGAKVASAVNNFSEQLIEQLALNRIIRTPRWYLNTVPGCN